MRWFAAQHSTAQHSTSHHSTAQHSTAQHSTAQHSTAQQGSSLAYRVLQSSAQHSIGRQASTEVMTCDSQDGASCHSCSANLEVSCPVALLSWLPLLHLRWLQHAMRTINYCQIGDAINHKEHCSFWLSVSAFGNRALHNKQSHALQIKTVAFRGLAGQSKCNLGNTIDIDIQDR